MLKVLQPFENNKKVLVYHQGVGDIIAAIVQQHSDMTDQYDLIYHYFADENVKKTAKKIWNYLKKNVKYNIEPDNEQYIKTPAAIIATGKSGSDCKNYALFSAGILDAYRRNTGEIFDLCFRFASYDDYEPTPQHVFVVINAGSDSEIWCDPVLDEFDLKKYPNYFKDKNIKMLKSLSGLYSLSGTRKNTDTNFKIGSIRNKLPIKKIGDIYSTGADLAANSFLPGSGAILNATGLDKVASFTGQALTSLLSSNGVSPSFFSQFPFASMLDNSTLHWKSRLAKLAPLTPTQRLAWYIQNLQQGNLHIDDAAQYNLLFTGYWTDKHNVAGNYQGSNDNLKVPYQLAVAWNQLLDQKYFQGQNFYPNSSVAANYESDGTKYIMHGTSTGVYNTQNLFLDPTLTPDYSQYQQQNILSTTTSSLTNGGISIWLILAVGAGIFLIAK